MSLNQIISRPLNIVLATIIVELGALILARNGLVGTVVNEWYDQFSMGAYVTDVASMSFGIFLALLLFQYVLPKSSFTPVNFVISVVVIQMTHDLLFGALVRAYRKGSHRMMDMFKRYVGDHGWKILIVDAVMMISSVLLVYAFLPVDDLIIYFGVAFMLYVSQFFVYR